MIKILERAKNMILKPKETWQEIASESNDAKYLFINYAAPLALIPTVSGLIGKTLVGIPMLEIGRVSFVFSLAHGLFAYVVHLVAVFVLAWIINILASSFGSKSNYLSAVKLSVYSITPIWLLGILFLIPWVGILASIFGLYWIYLFVVGLPIILNTPRKKVVTFSVAVVAISILINIAFAALIAQIFNPMYMRMMEV